MAHTAFNLKIIISPFSQFFYVHLNLFLTLSLSLVHPFVHSFVCLLSGCHLFSSTNLIYFIVRTELMCLLFGCIALVTRWIVCTKSDTMCVCLSTLIYVAARARGLKIQIVCVQVTKGDGQKCTSNKHSWHWEQQQPLLYLQRMVNGNANEFFSLCVVVAYQGEIGGAKKKQVCQKRVVFKLIFFFRTSQETS